MHINLPVSILLQVASELNAAILKMENRESTTPKLSNLLKLILWAQDELDKKKIKYPKMSKLANAVIDSPKWQQAIPSEEPMDTSAYYQGQ